MNDYFILNKETGKLELHFDKATYTGLSAEQKAEIKSNFLWGRNSGCWISRAKEPNLHWAREVAKKIGLEDAGSEGERLSFAEQQARKQERAERRADRYEGRAASAEQNAERLQAPLEAMRGDTAFFTQPIINSSAGRAFARRREKMFAAYEKGFDEFRKSEYWQSRAATARATAEAKELQNKGFVARRIKEREKDIRQIQKRIVEAEETVYHLEAGETVKNWRGEPISPEAAQETLEYWLDRMEVKLDELGFYQDCLDKLGGVKYSAENIKPGYLCTVALYGVGEVLSAGPKNVKLRFADNWVWSFPYAEIKSVEAHEKEPEKHPFKVGETFTCHRWNSAKRNAEQVTYTIIRATEKSVTLQTGEEKPIVHKPSKRPWSGDWYISVTDWNNGTWYKAPEKATEEDADAVTPEEFAAQVAEQ